VLARFSWDRVAVATAAAYSEVLDVRAGRVAADAITQEPVLEADAQIMPVPPPSELRAAGATR
jgi:hypothetical protein